MSLRATVRGRIDGQELELRHGPDGLDGDEDAVRRCRLLVVAGALVGGPAHALPGGEASLDPAEPGLVLATMLAAFDSLDDVVSDVRRGGPAPRDAVS